MYLTPKTGLLFVQHQCATKVNAFFENNVFFVFFDYVSVGVSLNWHSTDY